jgi:hypothetical protein
MVVARAPATFDQPGRTTMTATTKPAGPVSTSGTERDLGRFAGVAFAVTFFTAFTV